LPFCFVLAEITAINQIRPTAYINVVLVSDVRKNDCFEIPATLDNDLCALELFRKICWGVSIFISVAQEAMATA
jgi:hypothetical protein